MTPRAPIALRGAIDEHWSAIEALLVANRLPIDGAREHLAHFIVANEGGRVVGCVGLERHGDVALLRSLAVAQERQGVGIGALLFAQALRAARFDRLKSLVLLTTTAQQWFARRGFEPVARDELPESLGASAELRGACPASAVAMRHVIEVASDVPSRIRLARCDDAAAIESIYAPIVRETPISFELVAPTVDDLRARIAAAPLWLVSVDPNGRVDGYAYASRHRERAAYQWSVDVSAYVRADARGNGVGRRLYRALLDDLARCGYRQAFAGIALPNAASIGLHEAMGFVALGIYRDVGFKLGAWRDVGWWQCALKP